MFVLEADFDSQPWPQATCDHLGPVPPPAQRPVVDLIALLGLDSLPRAVELV